MTGNWSQTNSRLKLRDFLAVGVTRHWNNLPEEVVESPLPGVFQAKQGIFPGDIFQSSL